ncbi:MAG: hypothetical protein UR85_C0011G0007 [Candidatus Nomurabacteria bacterium GW2011_GWF2_35_66]|nr:MAG: hypothetical protein UR85_C0011G0007 [Candidatus Nomurabacteria bacterium GW2011_GWF2_35_66]HBM45413.1 hypothetical protein [Patescibacteria group bacterium]
MIKRILKSKRQNKNFTVYSGFFRLSQNNQRKNNINNAGFILLFSLLISSIMLTAGLGVARIITRQIYLASVQRNSQIALFAADTGLECGRYWMEDGSKSASPQCNGQFLKDYHVGNVEISKGGINATAGASFFFNLGTTNGEIPQTCVQVDVINTPTLEGYRQIIAKGYNVPCNNQGQPEGGQVVERELVYLYN